MSPQPRQQQRGGQSNRPSLDDYVDVAERIQDFKDAHPKGQLQRVSWEVREIGGSQFVVYTARAYPDKGADPEDYGEGTAWEPFPGRTPYTKDSELMNAETAAWGRAIVALGLVANRKLASRQEVRARMDEQDLGGQSAEGGRASGTTSATAPKPDESGTANRPASSPEVKTVDATSLGQLREKWLAFKAAWPADAKVKDEKAREAARVEAAETWLRFKLTELGVEDPTGDLGPIMQALTLRQAVELDEALSDQDNGVPGSGAANA